MAAATSVPLSLLLFLGASLSEVSLSATFEATVCKALGHVVELRTEQKTHPCLLEHFKEGRSDLGQVPTCALPNRARDTLL